MFYVALKSLLGHKLRMLLTTFAIVIGVSFVAGTYIFTDSMNSAFDVVFEDAYAHVDLTVRPTVPEFGESANSVPNSLLGTLSSINSVDKIEAEVQGSAQLIDGEGEPIGGAGPPTLGYSWTVTPELNSSTIKEGDGREPTGAGEVVIDVNTAESNNLTVGDTVRIQTNGPVEDFEIVGLLSFGETNALAGATLSAFELTEAQRLFGLGDNYSQIIMTAVDGVDKDEFKTQIDQTLPKGFESVTGEQIKSENLEEINEGLGFISTALLAFAGVSIFVGAFIIQNTFRIIISQRSKELALLRAIGATQRQVVSLVAYEALIISVFASAIGILVGFIISQALRSLSIAIGFNLPPGDLTLAPRTIAVAFAVGIGVTLFSALIPAIKASKVAPVEAMRDIEESTPRKSLHKRAITGLAVTGIGAAMLLYGLFSSITNPVVLVGAGAFFMFIGISIIAPLLSKPLANIIGWPVRIRYGVIGDIATGNTKRSPRRTASTAAALMIGVSLVVFVSIFASSIKLTIDKVIEGNFPGDITVTSKLLRNDPVGAAFPASVANDIEVIDEVEQLTRLKYDFMKIDGSELLIVAVEPDTFNAAVFIDPIENNYDNLGENDVYVKTSELENKNLSIGDNIEVEYALTGKNTLTITGSFKEPFDSPYLISDATYATNFSDDKDLLVVVNISEGVSVEEGKLAINEVLVAYPTVQAQDKGELIEQTREQIDQLLGLMSALLGFAVIIAVLGITNTLTLSVSERTREIGMLRAVGMTRSQVRKMIRAEAIIIAVFGAILGVIMGIFFGWAILKSLEEIGFSHFSIPIAQILFYLIMSAFAGVIAAILPSYKASKMKILDAINYE